jgi:ubiquinone biosynthesis protein
MKKNSVERFKEIVGVLGKYGFGYIVQSKSDKEKNTPENLRKAFEELGTTFIKIGQVLSTRPDILPTAYIDELSKLQDNVTSENLQDINGLFYKEFQKNIEDCFLKFDTTALASASIAEVHSAVMKDGTDVIIKIQRPYIYEKMKLDFEILYKIISLTKARFSDTLIDPKEALDEIKASTELELDFKKEAENIKKFKTLNEKVAFVYAPYIIDEFTSPKVITMERIYGFKINDIEKYKEGGYDVNDVGHKLALSFFKQVFNDGFFHADPHPGNLLISKGKICYIDFGIVGQLSASLKSALNDAVVGVALKDPEKLINVLVSIGVKKGYINRNKLYEEIDYLLDSYLCTSLQDIQMSILLQEVFECASSNNIQLPKDLTLLLRTLVILEGVISKISPEIKIVDIAVPFVKSNSAYSALKDFNLDDMLLNSYSFAKDFSKIPSKIIQLSESILNGRAKVQFDVSSLDKSVNHLNKMANRIVFALVISSMIVASSFILTTSIGPKLFGMSILGLCGYAFAGIFGIWLLLSIMKSGKL